LEERGGIGDVKVKGLIVEFSGTATSGEVGRQEFSPVRAQKFGNRRDVEFEALEQGFEDVREDRRRWRASKRFGVKGKFSIGKVEGVERIFVVGRGRRDDRTRPKPSARCPFLNSKS